MKEKRLKGFAEPEVELILFVDDTVLTTSEPRQFGDDWVADETDSTFFGG